MKEPLVVSSSRAYPLEIQAVFEFVIRRPLADIFDRRFALLPSIRSTDQHGSVDQPWGTVGQTRTIALADGGSMREELTEVDAPHTFGYRISDVTGSMKLLASSVEGQWLFEPAGTGTRITWTWTVHPASDVAALAMPLFGWLWQGYARQALERIEQLQLAG